MMRAALEIVARVPSEPSLTQLPMLEDEALPAWGGDPDACAEHFDVSGEAMRRRLYSFGLGEAPA